MDDCRSRYVAPGRVAIGAIAAAGVLARPDAAFASFLSPEAEDTLATVLAVFILFIVPVVLIVLFWLVHILPEQIAHKRHHPQFEAIRTLCLLSLVFGGLLWPLAWIWAYSKPVLHKMAYGTDKVHHGEGGEDDDDTAAGIHERLARLEERGVPPSELKTLRADLEALEQKFLVDEAR
jgi:CBS domain containing-hemolysin-like protein